ncbi:MAG: M23 family metallopeptidase [Bacteroidetes bacterium]|nr:M23 family metallopeptidase [Bacteroidota bacterium]
MPRLKQWIKKWSTRYRLVVLDDGSFEEQASVSLSRFNLFAILSTAIIGFTLLITSLIVFTPLREYIPGYADTGQRLKMLRLLETVDSLERSMAGAEARWMGFSQVVAGQVPIDTSSKPSRSDTILMSQAANIFARSTADSLLRQWIEQDFNDARLSDVSGQIRFFGQSLFEPVNGRIHRPFSPANPSAGLEIAVSGEQPVHSMLDGRIIFQGYSLSDQYVVVVQHSGNALSSYQKLRKTLRRSGESVKAGDVLGLAGRPAKVNNQAGEPQTISVQLWQDGSALNPASFLQY